MGYLSFGVLLVAFVSTTFTCPARAQAAQILDMSRESIIVRTYSAGGPDLLTRSARGVASAILDDAGVDVTWLDCRVPAEGPLASGACAQELRWNEVVVRVVPAGPKGPGVDTAPLGFAAVDLGAGRGSLATVYADRVAAMAQAAGIDGGALLGRAVAHEIGHLLLGTNHHTSRGLMRAYWSCTDLRRDPAPQWRFGGKESSLMRKGLASRRPA